jgi:hypothetical protein
MLITVLATNIPKLGKCSRRQNIPHTKYRMYNESEFTKYREKYIIYFGIRLGSEKYNH